MMEMVDGWRVWEVGGRLTICHQPEYNDRKYSLCRANG